MFPHFSYAQSESVQSHTISQYKQKCLGFFYNSMKNLIINSYLHCTLLRPGLFIFLNSNSGKNKH
jgi:hypothetical protein